MNVNYSVLCGSLIHSQTLLTVQKLILIDFYSIIVQHVYSGALKDVIKV